MGILIMYYPIKLSKDIKTQENIMKRKLLLHRGMTLTELLIALMVVSLVTVALVMGAVSAAKVYKESTQLFEAETLCGTILTYLEDEFRYGSNIRLDDGLVVFDSQTFGNGVSVSILDGKVLIGGNQLLGDAAYTSRVKVLSEKDDFNISYDNENEQVIIKVAVGSNKGTYVQHTVRVRPINS